MPFEVSTMMDQRRKLACEVIEGGMSLSAACRAAGVTRKTGRKWVNRARVDGFGALCERSRAPLRTPSRVDQKLEEALLVKGVKYPDWGPRKLVVRMQEEDGLELSLRTAERIWQRHGLTKPQPKQEPVQNFERDKCGALLQMDFKGLPKSTPYSVLTVLDDHARFCLGFGPVPDKSGLSVKAFLWDLFGEHGLPEEMLMDNGDCWAAPSSWAPSAFECWLMRLGIRPIHGRPWHPQTQGKVERFHQTAKKEIGDNLFDKDPSVCANACKCFVDRYNWVRPHDALAGQVPGKRYTPFARSRPDELPTPIPKSGDLTRKVQENGCISYKQREYKVGRGLIGEHVQLRDDVGGLRVFFADFPLAYISELGPSRTYGEL
jgi:transposase InsO family protein